MLNEEHDGTSGAHPGVNKTLANVREGYSCVHYREDVERWCIKCTVFFATRGAIIRLNSTSGDTGWKWMESDRMKACLLTRPIIDYFIKGNCVVV